MIDAAAAVFFEQGFERASLSAIVRRSGGSLTTLYQLFGNKEGLFEAMVTQRCGDVLEPLATPDMESRCPRATLTRLARALAGVLMDGEAQGLWRMVMGEGIKFPRLPEIYFRCGPDPFLKRLSAYLEGLHEKGIVHCPDSRWAAQAFAVLVEGELFFRTVTGMRPLPDAAELDAHVEAMVAGFMRMVAPLS